MPQRLDGVKVGSAKGGVNTKDDADENRDTKGQRHGPAGKDELQIITKFIKIKIEYTT